MSVSPILCLVPAARANLCEEIFASGAVPVVDITAHQDPTAVMDGAWIRARPGQPLVGNGPVILTASATAAIPDRPTWLEVTTAQPAPEGFAGVVIRGREAGGPCGTAAAMSMLADSKTPTLLALDTDAAGVAAAVSAGAAGVVLSDVLLAHPALELPTQLAARVAASGADTCHTVGGFQVCASPLSAGLRRLLAGEDGWDVSNGWWAADAPAEVLLPAGKGLALGRRLATLYPSLAALLAHYQEGLSPKQPTPQPAAAEAVAIVGLGCRLPDANSVDEFWGNLLAGHSSIRDVPPSRWEPSLYWSTDRKAPDKTYARIGGFLTSFSFNPRRFRIPPMVAKLVDPVQQIALESVADALEDAGYGDKREYDRSRVAVILGNSMGGEFTDDYAVRSRYPALESALKELPAFAALPKTTQDAVLADFESSVKETLPPITADSMPGELANVIAGRIANAFDLTGPNFTVDAACASSMAAIQSAVQGLLRRDFDMAVTGGTDRSMGVPTYVKFSKIGALSARHSAPFDAAADGFVMGEGCGVLVLKRLSDARADGDRIYAVIRGIGGSSDGRGKGIMAPNPRGQQLALRRAYEQSGIDPASVDLFECHGTSTFVGDRVELESLSEVIGAGRRDPADPVRVGSVKSNIGHLKSAAGAASCIKAALALHHKVLPPSINFQKEREDIDYSAVPLQVQTATEPWQTPRRRRAGVSAFGFGGVNFHMVLEEFVAADRPSAQVPSLRLPEGIWGVSADSSDGLITALQQQSTAAYDASQPVRLLGAETGERESQIKRVLNVLEKGRSPDILRGRGLHYQEGIYPGKIAFLFTGQGSQYIGMGLDLAEVYPVVRETFEEAERVLANELPRPLTSYIRRNPDIPEEVQFEQLRATEISQPATLTVDVALLRLLASYGVYPDMVAGHSLGEYAAAVASGMMSFPDALIAVSARGREMAAVQIDDPGRMAGVSASESKVQPIIDQVDGYVVAANKNCPTQTVIAGETTAVEQAMALFEAEGINVTALPVSHAFHSEIVAPASAPFKRVLQRLDVQPPRRPFLTNVDASYYSTDPADRSKIIDNLALQIASPVEWIQQIERMYADGARVFVECGPKRALTSFVSTILRRKEHRAISTNHPKRGGVTSFREALAALTSLGRPMRAVPGSADLFDDLSVSGPSTLAPAPSMQPIVDVLAQHVDTADLSSPADIAACLQDVLAAAPTASPSALPEPFLAALTEGAVRGGLSQDAAGDFAQKIAPALTGLVAAMHEALPAAPAPVVAAPQPSGIMPITEVVCSGVAIGLPGGDEVFAADNFDQVLDGNNRISTLPADMLDRIIEKRVMRLQKDAQTGQGEFIPVERPDQVIRLAGTKTHFDLVEDYGVDHQRARALDITTQLAFAAGIEALRDAGIPLVRSYRETRTGKRIADRWMLPASMRTGTGIIFACAFPGYTNFAEHLRSNGDDGEGRFDRRFLFQVLSMGHAQFAELIGAMGPNTQVNAACASTTQAVCIGSDWIRLGRCERVIVIGADDVTNETMMEWIGAGFLASGAATTSDRVEEAALPFDRRRHGMILGMGAVGMVLERAEDVAARGMQPIARLLAARFTNSAYHGTRLHPTHIAEEVSALVSEAEQNAQTSRASMANQLLFMSHETYTPARGGSAAAEIASLRHAFGEAARNVVITNTKGFTGHPMGAGIEDAVVLRALQMGRVPPIPNLKEPDPDLGDLRLSTGGPVSARFALRLAAGFGSQLALLAWEKSAAGLQRQHQPTVYQDWLRSISDAANPALVVEHRTLRLVADAPASQPTKATPASAASPAPPPQARPVHTLEAVLSEVLAVVSEKTGYGVEELEVDYELEADLGVDTVKQAEIFGVIRERYHIPQDDDFRLADYPTIEKLAGWVTAKLNDPNATAPTTPAPSTAPTATVQTPAEAPPIATAPAAAAPSHEAVLSEVLAVVSEKTGYGVEELDIDYELEADLGVDTVKQAEIFGVIRARYHIPQDDDFRLADYPTIEKLAGWVTAKLNDPNATAPEALPQPAPAPAAVEDTPEPKEQVVAAAAAAAPSHEAVLSEVLAVVSEKTGYGVEELDIDYELEADLGVDTVKQAEIFGVIRERYHIPQDDDFRLADYPTIEKLAGWVTAKLNDPNATAPAATPAAASHDDAVAPVEQTATDMPSEAPVSTPAPATVAPSLDHDAVLAALLSVVSEKTGYSVDELDVDYELEADLGVDTVKQAEIFGVMREQLGLAKDDDFRLADYPTIAALAGYLTEQTAAPAPHSPATEPTPVSSASVSSASVPSEDDPEALPEPMGLLSQQQSTAPSPPQSTAALPASFRIRRPVLIEQASWAQTPLAGSTAAVIGEGPFADAIREQLVARAVTLSDTAPAMVVDVGNDVMMAFERAQALDATRPTAWLCVTRLGADPTEIPAEDGVRAGARAGFTKALGREWEGCAARVVDVTPVVDDRAAAEIVCDELASFDGATEIFRDSYTRQIMALHTEAFPESGSALDDEPVIVLTGGTRGITAQVAMALAARGTCRLALLARTAPGVDPLDEQAEKSRIRAELKGAGERGTPAQIEARMRPLRRAEEARQNVEAMRAHGALVQFWSVDMADPVSVTHVLQQVRDFWGPIAGVVHGAGVEESRLIADKDADAFLRVFDGKALGGLSLVRALEPAAWFVSMGSVAGRFGNPGQVDYAAANEAMARVCLGRPRSLHVDWTAWGDVGMATRGGMEQLLLSRGMDLLPAQSGASLLVDMVLAEMWGEVVVAGRLGDLSVSPAHPLLDAVRYDGDAVAAERQVSKSRDVWMADHAIDGTPVLPGVMGLEMMAAAARMGQPGAAVVAAEKVAFRLPVKLYGDQPTTVTVNAESVDGAQVSVVLSSSRTSRAGKEIHTEHFDGTIVLGDVDIPQPLPPAILASIDMGQEGIYQRFFHGPSFQVLHDVVGVAQDGLEVDVRVDHQSMGGVGLLTRPLILEAAFQAAGLHHMIVEGSVALPSRIAQVVWCSAPADGAELWAVVRRRADGAYDVDIDAQDEPVLRLRGFEMVIRGTLPPGDRIAPPAGGWPLAIVAQASFEAPPRVETFKEDAQLLSRGTARRKRDRMAGQTAARQALVGLTGVEPQRFSILRNAAGAPVVHGVNAHVSISHRQGTGWAVATRRGCPGIDVEAIAVRDPAFARTWFTVGEQRLTAGDPRRETIVWTVKEAVLKALGTGLRITAQHVEITAIGRSRVTVVLRADAQQRLRHLGGGELQVCWWQHGMEIVAVAVLSETLRETWIETAA